MPITIDRQVGGKEQELFRRLKQTFERRGYDPGREHISLTQLASQHGIHESRARQIAKTWANDGLVRLAGSNPNKVTLTECGAEYSFP